jgi:hypothetical protein
MPARHTRRGGGKSYNSMSTDDTRKELRSVKVAMEKLEGEGESLTLAERAHHAVLLKKADALKRILKSRKHGKGRATRRH